MKLQESSMNHFTPEIIEMYSKELRNLHNDHIANLMTSYPDEFTCTSRKGNTIVCPKGTMRKEGPFNVVWTVVSLEKWLNTISDLLSVTVDSFEWRTYRMDWTLQAAALQ